MFVKQNSDKKKVTGVQTQMQSFNFFSGIQLEVLVLMHTDNKQYTHVMLQNSVNCKSMFLNITRYERGSKFT